ncbi:MAG TPA: SMR family transporter [Chroococcales cyanobacterium]
MAERLLGMLLLLCATTFEALGQLSLKSSAASKLGKAHERKWLVIGVLCFATEIILWTFVLTKLAVNTAFPMSSLSFVIIALLSRWVLKEHVSGKRWAGVWLILCGTSLVGVG